MSAAIETLSANLCAALDGAGQIIGMPGTDAPRFSLFHAANSICSQKVRVVLAQHQITYTSHTLNIFAGQTYLPDHVKLRLIGCDFSGLPLVTAHSGSTSVSFGGCDPAVVPTLVDHHVGVVIVDSKRICLYLDAIILDLNRLRPTSLQGAIDVELNIVDNMPNYQMLVGQPPGPDQRPDKLRARGGADFSLSKVQRCDQYLAEFGGDPSLVAAYGAKRAKELDASNHLFSEDAMRLAYAKADTACTELNRKLEHAKTTWLMGNSVSMADLFWAVELIRLKNLGAGSIWERNRLPEVEAFVAEAEQLPCVTSAVLDWPDALFS
jgi:2,5-dichlorohydroquinone reductive dechlorinase